MSRVRGGTGASRLSATELRRRTVHIGAGLLALGLRWVGALPAALFVSLGVLFNALALPRLRGLGLWRREELEAGRAPALVVYPLSVLLLIVAFRGRLEVAAAAWGLLAFGDGFAPLAGRTIRGPNLPWNPGKTWAGTAAFWIAGSAASTLLLTWTAPGRYALPFAAGACALTALVAALAESLPLELDDNLSVPPLAGLLLWCLLLTEGHWTPQTAATLATGLLVGLAASLPLAVAAAAAGVLDRKGAAAGAVLGSLIYAGLGWRGLTLLAAFVALGFGATRAGRRRPMGRSASQRRGVRNVLANALVPAFCALFAYTTPYPEPFTIAFAGALAAMAADTVSGEIGQTYGGRPVLVTTGRRVAPGTDGAVSWTGTLAGLAAAAALASLTCAVGSAALKAVPALVVAGLLANGVDSLLGATLERRGLVDNEAVNFLASLLGALAAVGLSALPA